MLPISLRFGWRGGGGGGIEPKNKQRTIYVERVRHYSINGCMHVVPISLRFPGGWGGLYENGNTTVTTLYHQYISTVWEIDPSCHLFTLFFPTQLDIFLGPTIFPRYFGMMDRNLTPTTKQLSSRYDKNNLPSLYYAGRWR